MKNLAPQAISVPMKWEEITASDKNDWPFTPDSTSDDLAQKFPGPKVYRFFFEPEGDWADCYVGEAESLPNRLQQYMRAVKNARPENSIPEGEDIDWSELCQKMRDPSERKRLLSGTETRIAALILNAERTGRKVTLASLDFSDFYFNRIEISPEGLNDIFIRRMVENLMILIESNQPNVRMLNRGHNASSSFRVAASLKS
ncbi:MAG: hypothetical protein ACLGRW_02810 [Acidobacteriota bacterium]